MSQSPETAAVPASTIDRRPWKEFQEAGLLWWVNHALHVFGWSIVFECEENGDVVNVYPARTSWLGFNRDADERGYLRLRKHIATEAIFGRLAEARVPDIEDTP